MPDLQDVRELIADNSPGRVSAYLPTHEVGSGTRQDQIRLANLLDDAERSLTDGLGRKAARRIVAPGRRLVRNHNFWLHQSRGLAVLLSPDIEMRSYRLPINVRERVVVSDRFHVKPLLALLSGDGRFYILAVSQARVRLFVATRDTIRQLDLHDIPDSLRKAVGYDWEQKTLQFHTAGTHGGGAGGGLVFHGQGAGADDSKKEIQRYFRAVDAGVRDLIGNRRGPVVLATVDYLRPIYRLVSKLPQLLPHGVGGNPDHRPAEQLHEQAWTLVAPLFEAGRREAERTYEELHSGRSDKASDDLEHILPAVFGGRVETLFVSRDAEAWGRFDAHTSVLLRHDHQEPGDCDLLDLAAAEALNRNGNIYALHADEMPGGGQIAAIYRY
ncbi:MAG: hypothetical protein OEM96_08575 [Gemmatimonadota bacterium]|nr:hypothetical protein [Gemmatimonadota bacterium]